ncbi:hypothetical protein SCLCIDRAFT_468136 [Scleroderma citrinum Foug A]|uniref:Uncharacterized protein n=1 Tax=Scleroderma citrinum Foug A TaxID=1036808 RepID=A0A0C3AKD1_9AGAM|nr:hypothetical protein SCLCIDRAFT_468136 [Scleroderma citrinum Foug A]
MDTMVSWWTLVIDALGKVEDATHRMRGVNGIDDSTVMVSITRVTRALYSYCEAYVACPDELHKAASGISL